MKIPLVDALPWNHFGRKNVGFLYAILHGAEIIWDFDDDNLLKFHSHYIHISAGITMHINIGHTHNIYIYIISGPYTGFTKGGLHF